MTGLVSISFRKNSPAEIVEAVKKCGLDAIEWGGDIHAPHGDAPTAEAVGALTRENGLEMPEYGSYYAIGNGEPELWSGVLISAKALKTKAIRVWAGMGIQCDDISCEAYEGYVADARRICADAGDILVCLECHPHTLTDEYHTALRFLRDVNMPNLKMMWQPDQFRTFAYNIDAINALYEYIYSVHVFAWERNKRYSLAMQTGEWKQYIKLLGDKSYMLEFMPDDKIETLAQEAEILKGMIK